MLIPVLKGFVAVMYFFILAFIVNIFFISNKLVSKFILWFSLVGSIVYSIYSARNEFPEVPMLMVAFVAGSVLCYFFYVLGLKFIRLLIKAFVLPDSSEEKLP